MDNVNIFTSWQDHWTLGCDQDSPPLLLMKFPTWIDMECFKTKMYFTTQNGQFSEPGLTGDWNNVHVSNQLMDIVVIYVHARLFKFSEVHCAEREEKGTLQNLQMILESFYVDAMMDIISTIEVLTDIYVIFDNGVLQKISNILWQEHKRCHNFLQNCTINYRGHRSTPLVHVPGSQPRSASKSPALHWTKI